MAKGENDFKDRVLDAGDELVLCGQALDAVISLLAGCTNQPNPENLCQLLRCVNDRLEKTKFLLRVV